jgi:Asp-tRNA(Asn)/Glu-tRNA(Gln) amidotransferase A subunit family amidase
MNETTAAASDAANSAPLNENEYVQQLFSILQASGRDTTGLAALLGHVSEMENFVKRAEDKIADMKSQLAEMKEVQNHPVKTALQNAIKTLEHKVAEVKERLSELKHSIAEGCMAAVQSFKEKGVSALDNLASFFHIKSGLRDWNKSIDSIIKTDDKAVARIESFAAEYHSAGRGLKNMGRILAGKEPIDAKKEAGKLSKALAAPYKAQKSALLGLKKAIGKAIDKLDALETAAADNRANRVREPEEPSLLQELAETKELVEQRKLEIPTPERVKSKAAEL